MNTAQRRWVWSAIAVIVVALVLAVPAWIGAQRVEDGISESDRAAVLSASDTAVTALLNFGPETTPETAGDTAALLTDPLALEYRARGYDAVVAGAIGAGVQMSTRVLGVGLHTHTADWARVLVFVDQELRSGRARPAQPTPTARWATMRKVDGNWLLADLQPVGDITR